ncbi:MAG: 50S ribosomal protein L13 [Candidatus Omnitrophota bacterium]
MKTYIARKQDLEQKWYLIDAKNKVLGRLAVNTAKILRGKHKAIYTPNVNTGDGVVIINASKIRVSGRKLENKIYAFYSGYPGGKKEIPLKTMLAKQPTKVVRLAVQRMLPSGPLAYAMLKKLRVYALDKHMQSAQKLEEIK